MAPLQNAAIERPEKIFYVELIIFGTITREAVRRTISVLAQTGKGAKKICKSRYRRSEIKSTREAVESRPPLFPLGFWSQDCA
ncbi:MAG TPA: hypothetical protein VM571_03960 [Noviherbaspirillum sp.]|nr:hypothetical protein [Noviherbaspirillum sp.]